MAKLGNNKEKSVGIDIGTYAIKAVSVENSSDGKILTAFDIKNIPSEAKSYETQRFIEEVMKDIGVHPEEVNLSLSGPDVIVRFIDLPKMTKDQLANALTFEAEKYIPFNVKEVVLDSIILGDADEAGHMKVLLAAAKREPIEYLVKMFDDIGIIVRIMDISSFAMFNAFLASNPLTEDKGNVFLDLGHSQTDILISIGGAPCFMRQVQIGGKDVTATICRDMSVTKNKAEEYKLGRGGGDKEAIKHATESILDDLVKEIQLSFGYFENRYNKGVSDIYCTGGMVSEAGVLEFLSERLGLEVQKWDPVKGLKISENLSAEAIKPVSSQLAVGIGLALRGFK